MARKKSKKKDFQLTDEGLGEYIFNSIIKDVRDLKSQVIDNIYSNEHKALSKPQDFLTKVNDFLKFWYNYGKRTADLIESQGVTDKTTDNLKYDFVKKYMFGQFDFKSVLLYVDGVMKQIYEEDKKYSKESLNDFYKYTLRTAYGVDELSATSLITDLEVNDQIQIPTDGPEFDINMISDYQIFKEDDYTDLFKSIEAVIDFLGFNKMKRLFQIKKFLNNKLLTSFVIKSIFDYIEFSLYLFAIRMYVVSRFLSGFIDGGEKPDPFSESVINEDDPIGSFLKRMVIFKLDIVQAHWYGDSIFASMDEMNARSLDKTKLYKMIRTFLDVHGIRYSDKPIQFEAFKKEYSKYFKESQVFDFFMSDDPIPKSIDEYYLKLKYLIHVPNMALLTSEKPVHNHKTRFFDMIIKMGCGSESVADCKKGAILIYYFLKEFLDKRVKMQLDRINGINSSCDKCSMIKPSEVTTVRKLYSEMNNFLSGFYDELSYICFRVLQYLENKIFYYEHELKRTGIKKDDTAEPHNNLIRPVGQNFDQIYWDDQSIFNENSVRWQMYPFYENMQLYYKYLRSIPEFQELGLFTEDVDAVVDKAKEVADKAGESISKGWDGFVAWINSIWEKIKEWFGNATVQGCFKWVKDHANDFNKISGTWCPQCTLNNVHLYRPLVSGDTTELDFIKDLTKKAKELITGGKNQTDKEWLDQILSPYKGNRLPKIIMELIDADTALAKRVVRLCIFYSQDYNVDGLNIKTSLLEANKIEETTVEKLEKGLVTQLTGSEENPKDVSEYIHNICLANVNLNGYEKLRNLLNETSKTIKESLDYIKKQNIGESVSDYLLANSEFRYFDEALPNLARLTSQSKKPVPTNKTETTDKETSEPQSEVQTTQNTKPNEENKESEVKSEVKNEENKEPSKENVKSIDIAREKVLDHISKIIVMPTLLYLSTWISNQYKILTGVHKLLPKKESK